MPPDLVVQVRSQLGLPPPGAPSRSRVLVPAAVVVIALCAAGGMLLSRSAAPDAVAPVASAVEVRLPAHVVSSIVERHRLDLPVDVASPDARRVEEFVMQRTGHSLVVPRLERQGFGLEGGRIVDVATAQGSGRRAAQLVYRGGYGQRVSVVAVPDPDGALAASLTPNAAVNASSEGVHVRMLSRGNTMYSFVGDVDEDGLTRLSDTLDQAR